MFLTEKLTADKLDLENLLVQLYRAAIDQTANIANDAQRIVRRPRNPDDASETWSGRGKLPRWLDAKLKSGMKMETLLINQSRKGPRNPDKAKKRRQTTGRAKTLSLRVLIAATEPMVIANVSDLRP